METWNVRKILSYPNILPFGWNWPVFNLFAILQVGNWSRWFSNHLGLELDTLPSDDPETNNDDQQTTRAKTKCFCLLNELSELLMLPKDMLMDESIRKEVKKLSPFAA